MPRKTNVPNVLLMGCLVILGMLISAVGTSLEGYQTHYEFLTREECETILRMDYDRYVGNMSPADLKARNAKTHEDYVKTVAALASDFTQTERERIEQLAGEVDRVVQSMGTSVHPIVDVSLLIRIPWAFAKVDGTAYEGGMPHTRGVYIFLSPATLQESDYQLRRTLLHEKVHLYQRLLRSRVQAGLLENGYKIVGLSAANALIRANPDLDQYIWEKDERVYIAEYVSSEPNSIHNVKARDNGPSSEHPFEEMAYAIASTVFP